MSIIQGTSKSSAAAYEIDQSIRFNDNDSASLTRTPSSAGNRRTFTFSCWVKRANLTGANQPIFSAAGDDWLMFLSAETLGFNTSGSNYRIVTSQVFVDSGAWFHLVLRVDTTNATAGDRLRLYINGSEVTDFGTDTNPTLNFDTAFNNTGEHRIGKLVGASQFFDGYLAEINHVDGSSLAPTEFGKTDADTGQWVPIEYTGSYGTNGFHIDGRDSSDLGDDESGNGNDFTSSGLAAADQMSDSPTNNQATFNPLWAGATLSDGNLVATASGNSYQWATSTIAIDDGGKYACEFQKSSGTFGYVGIFQIGNHTATTGNNYMYGLNLGNGEIVKNSTLITDIGAGAANSLMRIEYDSSADTIKIFDDGTEVFPASTGVSNTVGLTGHDSLHFGCAPYASGTVITATFSPLSGTPTTDFKELTAPNLPDPTTANAGDYFQTVLYTGNNTDGHAITGVGFQPDWVWIKDRDTTASHAAFDAVRGVSGGNGFLIPNNTDTEGQGGATNTLVSLDSDGFTLDDDTEDQRVNFAGGYVAWCWKANGSGSSNTDGSITSTVSANTTSGFSIVSYSGNATSGATVGHGLGADVKMIILKDRGVVENWAVFHEAMGPTKVVYLNTADGAFTVSNRWNDTSPTSSVFTLGNETQVNGSGRNYIAYCFAEVDGFSKFGGYEGNGSSDGPFVYLGFKPRFLMVRRYDSGDGWAMLDTARGSGNFGSAAGSTGIDPTAGNEMNNKINANDAFGEEDNAGGSRKCSFLSNGFKVKNTNTAMNTSGGDYLYMAFAESPFQTATAR